jgi:hypothetical protein
MRLVYFAIFSFIFLSTKAQQEKNIEIGDTVFFAEITTENFEYIDLFKKTRCALNFPDFFQFESEEFYQKFYLTGDFDASRMPAEYANTWAVIKHIALFPDEMEDQQNKLIVIALLPDGKSTAHITEKAFEEGEVLMHL